ncbi:programmed cell death protein 2-like [Saccoglossus kowalevskii]
MMSTVLLGVCDEPLLDSITTWKCNKIGSFPDWMTADDIILPRCKLCSECLVLLVQIYCPVSIPHRTLYVFTCISKSCQNKPESWLVWRSQCFDTEKPVDVKKEQMVTMATNDWCDEADDWGDEDTSSCLSMATDSAGLNQSSVATAISSGVVTKPEKLSDMQQPLEGADITASKLEKLNLRDNLPCFVGFYIAVFEEEDDVNEEEVNDHEKQLVTEYEEREGISLSDLQTCAASTCSAKSEGKEKYEKIVAKHGDKTFQKYLKRISLCPEQCIRYQWNGTPLLMTSSWSDSDVPKCQYCGVNRIFELQIMPAIIPILKLQPYQGNYNNCGYKGSKR